MESGPKPHSVRIRQTGGFRRCRKSISILDAARGTTGCMRGQSRLRDGSRWWNMRLQLERNKVGYGVFVFVR